MARSEPGDRLTADEVAAVLKRATELDLSSDADPGGDVEVAALEQAAGEVGVGLDAVRQAVAELRVGALEVAPRERAGVAARRLVAPVVAADQRVLPLTVEAARAAAARILRRQAFEPWRSADTRVLWRRRADLASSVRRATDISGRIKLRSLRALVVTIVPIEVVPEPTRHRRGTDGTAASCLVRVEVDLTNLRPAVLAGAAVPAAVVSAAGVAAAIGAGEVLLLGVTGLGGVAAGAGGLGIGRIWYRRQHQQTTDLLGWLLDEIARA